METQERLRRIDPARLTAFQAELLRKDRNLEQTEHQPLKARIAGYLYGKRLEM